MWSQGLKAEIRVLEYQVPAESLLDYEDYWIKTLLDQGEPLFNVVVRGRSLPDSQIRKMKDWHASPKGLELRKNRPPPHRFGPNKVSYIRNCQICGEEFECKNSLGKRCDKASCKHKSHLKAIGKIPKKHGEHGPSQVKYDRECAHCQEPFQAKNSRGTYCKKCTYSKRLSASTESSPQKIDRRSGPRSDEQRQKISEATREAMALLPPEQRAKLREGCAKGAATMRRIFEETGVWVNRVKQPRAKGVGNKIRHDRVCEVCGKAFEAKNSMGRLCSGRCRKIAVKERKARS